MTIDSKIHSALTSLGRLLFRRPETPRTVTFRIWDGIFRIALIALAALIFLGIHGWYRWAIIGVMAVSLYGYRIYLFIMKRRSGNARPPRESGV